MGNNLYELQHTRSALVEVLNRLDELYGFINSDSNLSENWKEEIERLNESVERAKKIINHYG